MSETPLCQTICTSSDRQPIEIGDVVVVYQALVVRVHLLQRLLRQPSDVDGVVAHGVHISSLVPSIELDTCVFAADPAQAVSSRHGRLHLEEEDPPIRDGRCELDGNLDGSLDGTGVVDWFNDLIGHPCWQIVYFSVYALRVCHDSRDCFARQAEAYS